MASPLVQKRLDIRLGKHAASGGNGIEPLAAQAQLIQFIRRHIQQRCHLIDKGPRAAGAGTVHPFVNTAVKENDLCVLSPQFNDHRGIRLQLLDYLASSKHLLDEGHLCRLGQAQARRTGDGRCQRPVSRQRSRLRQQFQGLLTHLREMALVLLI